MSRFFIALTFLFFSISVSAQEMMWQSAPFFNSEIVQYRNQQYQQGSNAIWPVLIPKKDFEKLKQDEFEQFGLQKHKTLFARKVFDEHLLRLDSSAFSISFDPIFNLHAGQEMNQQAATYTNMRGARLEGTIGQKVYFYSSFTENQAVFPEYINNYIDQHTVVPGQGRTKYLDNGGYDFSTAEALVAVKLLDNWRSTIGTGKIFVGNGYRSMLLSDVPYNYPYFRNDVTFLKGRMGFSNVWSTYQKNEKVYSAGDNILERKAGSTIMLYGKPYANLEIMLFQNTQFERWDADSNSYELPWQYYVPVFGLNESVQSPTQSYYGLNINYSYTLNGMFYSQWMTNNGKNAYQLGWLQYDVARIKGLQLRVEYNAAQDGVYGTNESLTDYYHLNQPLGHIKEGEFNEVLVNLGYNYKRFFAEVMYFNMHQNATQNYAYWQVAYLINPATYINVFVEGTLNQTQTVDNNWVRAGLRTSLNRRYYDF